MRMTGNAKLSQLGLQPLRLTDMRYLLPIVFCLFTSCAWAFPPGFIGAVTQSGVAAPSGPLSSDTFTGTDGTFLTSHTSDSSHTWGNIYGAGTLKINSNTIYETSAGGVNLYYSSFTPSSADYSVKLTVTGSASGVTMLGPCARVSTSATTGYMSRYDSGTWSIYAVQSGVVGTAIGSYTGSPLPGPVVAKLTVNGGTVSLKLDDVERISVTNSSISATGRPGIGSYYSSATIWNNVDSFEVTQP